MQINRLFEMVYILMDRKKMTAKELSDHFEVSQRTIYRDVEILNTAGIPVSANKGKGGGIELLENFLINRSAFSEHEQNEIVFALQSFRALKYVNADNVLKKLSAIFNKDVINWIDVDFSDWTVNGKEKFNIIKSAIFEKKCLSFDYFSTNGEKTHRTVYPMQLWFKHSAWYIKAFCLMRRDYRLFKISRIKNPSVSSGESNFEVADLTELEIFQFNISNTLTLDDKSGEFYYEEQEDPDGTIKEIKTTGENLSSSGSSDSPNPKNNVDLKLWVDVSHAHRVFDEFDEENIQTDENGNFIIRGIFPEDEWLYGYILSFNYGAEVLEPLYFRDKIIDKLQKTLMKYL
ncbi:MAG: YafY family transcriptional regulator [Oscillospiraceae bacterium]|nr:YafY family transcriptional regulator [Oscillospiraceae bacterium]